MDEHGGDPDDPAAAARETVIDAFGRSAEVYGFNRSYGRLYGILYFAEGALSMDELVAESGYAKSTVSTAMQSLERLHMVHRSARPGEGRKAYFEAERDFWYIFRELVNQEGRRELTVMRRALDDAEEKLERAPDTEAVRRDRDRVENLRTLYDRFERMVDVVSRLPLERLLGMLGQGGDREDR
jgi:DNA-binding transcriptional regulator GbsR (MarR family)